MPSFVFETVNFHKTLKNHSSSGQLEIKFAFPEMSEYISKSNKTQDQFLKSLKGLSWCDVYLNYKLSLLDFKSWKYAIKNFIYFSGLAENPFIAKFFNISKRKELFLKEDGEQKKTIFPLLLKIKSYKTYKRDIAVTAFFKNIQNLKQAGSEQEKKELEVLFNNETKKLRSYISHNEVEQRLTRDGYTKLATGMYLKINTRSKLPQLVVDEKLYDFDMKNGWSHNQMCNIMSLAFSIYLNKEIKVCHV
jgi:hypothetical protein